MLNQIGLERFVQLNVKTLRTKVLQPQNLLRVLSYHQSYMVFPGKRKFSNHTLREYEIFILLPINSLLKILDAALFSPF